LQASAALGPGWRSGAVALKGDDLKGGGLGRRSDDGLGWCSGAMTSRAAGSGGGLGRRLGARGRRRSGAMVLERDGGARGDGDRRQRHGMDGPQQSASVRFCVGGLRSI
jgi:hypothetical protein